MGPRCLVMVDAGELTSVPGGLLVTPIVYQGDSITDKLPVLVTNCSERTITIPAKAAIGHAMLVTIASPQVCNDTIPRLLQENPCSDGG